MASVSTFQNYDSNQAACFARRRRSYSSAVYEVIVNYHIANGGQFHRLLDVGCGSGGSTRGLASYFDLTVGVDLGRELILQARAIGGETKTGKSIQYEIGSAENVSLARTVEDGSVDLLLVGMAAHWFNLEEFWPKAARLVKTGGAVALWTKSSLYCHPSTPSAASVQKILSNLEDGILGPYETHSNRLSRNMYDQLAMPWDAGTCGFSPRRFKRLEWNRNGKLEAGEADFFGGSEEMTLKDLGESLGTASMVTRWREDNPTLIGTDDDCVNLTMRKTAAVMGEDGPGLEAVKIKVGSSTTLLLYTRVADE